VAPLYVEIENAAILDKFQIPFPQKQKVEIFQFLSIC